MIFNWIGDIDLDPPLDEWKETTRAFRHCSQLKWYF